MTNLFNCFFFLIQVHHDKKPDTPLRKADMQALNIFLHAISHTKFFSSLIVMYKDGDRCYSVGMYAHICLPTGSTSLDCFTAQTRDFVLLQTAQTGSGAQTPFNSFGAGCTLLGGKGADP